MAKGGGEGPNRMFGDTERVAISGKGTPLLSSSEKQNHTKENK